MNCSGCGCKLTEEMLLGGMCFNCGQATDESVKSYEMEQVKKADEAKKMIDETKKSEQEQKEWILKEAAVRFNIHKLTTGYNFENHSIVNYLGLVSGEIVLGTGYFSDLSAGISDLLGVVSIEYSEKLKKAKTAALNEMIKESVKIGGNAIIGISFEYLTFSGNMIGVSINGTSVLIKSKEE